MRLVAVTRILNEDDIVEAFVRHNAVHVGHMIFLDNGSTDRTLAILKALKDEGFPLTVFQTLSARFDEASFNTWLYRLADQMHRADWVIFLDADEFIAAETETSLAEALAGRDDDDQAITVPLIHYFDYAEDDRTEPVVPVRMRWRMRAPTGTYKIFVRGGLGTRVVIDAGNHCGFLDGRMLPAPLDRRIGLAHYSRRSGWQNLHKIVNGWLKILAAGEAAMAQGWAAHYRAPFEQLRDTPGTLVGNPLYFSPGADRSIAEEAPLAYRGGALRYTEPADPALKALELLLRYAEQLARSHGRLIDQSVEARRLADGWNAERRFLF